ncbi:Lrp/AsnC ligand binding domain-containing protein [Streptomyces diastatochromogenes]|nr:Lrp/AsnC ligand binding domain-containing protein [Streptomyces diastatochromogenes]
MLPAPDPPRPAHPLPPQQDPSGRARTRPTHRHRLGRHPRRRRRDLHDLLPRRPRRPQHPPAARPARHRRRRLLDLAHPAAGLPHRVPLDRRSPLPRGTGPAHPRPGTTNGATRAPRHRHRTDHGSDRERPGHLHGTRPPRRHHRAHCPPAAGHAPARPGPAPGDRARPRAVGRARRSPAVDRRTPGALQETAQTLSSHPHVRFCAAITGPANLLVALAAADLDALYTFLTDTVGPLDGVTAIDTTPLLATVKRTGLIRH